MYPFIRLGWQLFKHRNDPKLSKFGTHVSQHICWPWDLDMFLELNNGRALTLYDLGRMTLSTRNGLIDVLKTRKWGMAITGATVRYRRRVRIFDCLEMRTRAIGFDEKFIYLEQSMWKTDGECASHAVFRSAITDKNGIVVPQVALEAMGYNGESPAFPDWVQDWIDSESQRPWPPMQDT